MEINNYQKYFEDNGYVIVPGVLDESSLLLAYNYAKIKIQSIAYKHLERKDIYNENWDGGWRDIQSPNTYSCYGDPFFDTLLYLLNGRMNEFTGLNLIPTYSYWRFYETGDVLKKHKDRESCEISTTIPLGFDVSNVEDKDYNWPIWVENYKKEPIIAPLQPGDLLIYRGCELNHWRDEFKGLHQAQVFCHYNNKNGPFNHVNDGRPGLGMPKLWSK